MNFTKSIYAAAFACLFLTACSDFTELQPKGKNLLSTTEELEMLLNAEFTTVTTDMKSVASDLAPVAQNLETLLSAPVKTREAILVSFDDSDMDHFAELTASDADYENYYGYIGRIANPILQRIDEAEGDDKDRARIKAEAYMLRAYSHFILVNKFAKAYNPQTASSDPGIPYMKEDSDITELAVKSTVKEVYDNILADIDAAIALNSLPVNAANAMRFNLPAAHAARAFVLMSLQRYEEAEQAAKEALTMNSVVDDYNTMLSIMNGMFGMPHEVFIRPQMQCQEDLFFTFGAEGMPITTEAWNYFEPGSICHDNLITMNLAYDFFMDMGMQMLGVPYEFVMDVYSGWNGAGLKTAHMYLIISECELRKGNVDVAMENLDKLRVNRISSAVYQPLQGVVTEVNDGIEHLKQTSHGENIFSVYNFINRKRWNQTEWRQTFTRNINGKVYSLTPENRLWIFPFPMNVVANNPNLTQNY